MAAARLEATEETRRRLSPASRFTRLTSLTLQPSGPKAPSHTLREPLPAFTLAPTSHFSCAITLACGLQPPSLTPFRSTNGSTRPDALHSSRTVGVRISEAT
jgi:hypothetical protein